MADMIEVAVPEDPPALGNGAAVALLHLLIQLGEDVGGTASPNDAGRHGTVGTRAGATRDGLSRRAS